MALPSPSPESTCLVTGASSGIGVELARGLAARGHGLTLVARREERLRDLAAELGKEHDVRIEVVTADVSDGAERSRLANEISRRGLTVEVLVNNAGFGSGGAFVSLDGERETEMVRTNVEAVVGLSSVYLPGMVERGRGALLNIGSLISFQPVPFQATYGASKAFVLSFTDALHEELRGTGVTATAVCPDPCEPSSVSRAGSAAPTTASPPSCGCPPTEWPTPPSTGSRAETGSSSPARSTRWPLSTGSTCRARCCSRSCGGCGPSSDGRRGHGGVSRGSGGVRPG